jgi:hypothetical protein
MSVLLFIVGAIVTMAGVTMVGYGIPINEFSFGNTLIAAGTTAAVGGLIIIGIAAAVGKLQRVAEMLATRTSARSSRPLELAEPAGSRAAATGQVSFPPRPKSETAIREPQPAMAAPTDMPAAVAPTLRNPDMAAVAVEEYEVAEYENFSLSPQQPIPAPANRGESLPPGINAVAAKHAEPTFDTAWRFSSPPQERQPQTDYFDAMWPAEAKPAKGPVVDEAPPPSIKTTIPEAPSSRPASEPPVAILKSGVVDGMGYTLYVDGSIEAELPQGTLRFASINDLRNHLEKNA